MVQSSSLPSIPHLLGAIGTTHSGQPPPHARATWRVGQRGDDLHRRDEGRRGASNRAQHQESHDGDFWDIFELASRLRGVLDVPERCSQLPTMIE